MNARRQSPGPRRRGRGKSALTKAQWRKKQAEKNRTYIKSMGEVTYVDPTARDVDGFPRLAGDQVYVFATSDKYHTHACAVVMGMWDLDETTVRVALQSGVGKRTRCKTCADESL